MFFFQAEDGVRGAQESGGLGGVYKRQMFRRLADRVTSAVASVTASSPSPVDALKSMGVSDADARRAL